MAATEPSLVAGGRIRGVEVGALLQGVRLMDLRLDDPAVAGPRVGEIWSARVDRLVPRQKAAFLDLGGDAAYLPDAEGATPGQPLLVEILRPAEGAKAARATRKLTYRGRWLAHTPSAPGVNLSRRIRDAAAIERLRAALAPFAAAGGFVIRTAAADIADAELVDEAERLIAAAAEIERDRALSPRRLRPAPAPLDQIAWDWPAARRLDAAAGAGLLDQIDVADQIDALLLSRVALDPGWMRLERAEALVAIDVNTGADASPLVVNLAAAAEIPRQLRLRGWGGMVVIDFAGQAQQDRERIEKRLRERSDPSLAAAGWGPLGLLELRRRSDRPALETVWKTE